MPIKTLVGALGLAELANDQQDLFIYIDLEVEASIRTGDLLGAGEWLANKIVHLDGEELEDVFSQVVALWASPQQLTVLPKTVHELLGRSAEFVPEYLALAVASAVAYMRHHNKAPKFISNVSYRLQEIIARAFGLDAGRPQDVLDQAVAKVEAATNELVLAVRSFGRTNCVTARRESIDRLSAKTADAGLLTTTGCGGWGMDCLR